jgi:hypothetical protein
MQVELKPMTLDVSEQAVAYLLQLRMTPEDYAAEVLRNHLETLALADQGKLENRPDWQEAIRIGRAEIRSGLGVPDEQADEWLKSHHG